MQRDDLISRGVVYKAGLNIISSFYPTRKTEAPEATHSHGLLIHHFNPRICLLINLHPSNPPECSPGALEGVSLLLELQFSRTLRTVENLDIYQA